MWFKIFLKLKKNLYVRFTRTPSIIYSGDVFRWANKWFRFNNIVPGGVVNEGSCCCRSNNRLYNPSTISKIIWNFWWFIYFNGRSMYIQRNCSRVGYELPAVTYGIFRSKFLTEQFLSIFLVYDFYCAVWTSNFDDYYVIVWLS